MCCFTGAVSVSRTSIFARDAGDGRQYIAYKMTFRAQQEVAMVLPLPVPAGTGETAVTFISLADYPNLFSDLYRAMEFPVMKAAPERPAAAPAPAPAPLVVHQVGSFEASFVPTLKDFERLDARFRLPRGTWEKLPLYKNHGFAVFKLKPDVALLHPIAFSFPRTDASALIFPTVHIHDGLVHEQAEFNHFLYAQVGDKHISTTDIWHESPAHAQTKVDVKKSAGLIVGDQHIYCREMRGKLPNQDTLLKFG